jgi:hopene-associated glycosyltransferase HpnB
MAFIFFCITLISLTIWIYLLAFRGRFWRADRRLNLSKIVLDCYPAVCAVIPARDEAKALPKSLKSLLTQDYPGEFSIILVDDQSVDGTAQIAKEIAEKYDRSYRLTVVSGQPLPSGWTGKLWAMEQGIRQAQQHPSPPQYFLLTDADIEHHPTNLEELIAKAEQEHLDLTSLMVLLRCESFWERFLIPAFVFFFQKLYPFAWVNDRHHKMAAAAGGCILIRREALNRIGGIEILRQALIDDCSLAQAVKSSLQAESEGSSGGIWLGLSESTKSLRTYPSLPSIWNLVARTAYTQLHYSPWLLMGTLISMTLVYLVPPISFFVGLGMSNGLIAATGGLTWGLMALSYLPTLRLYQRSPLWSLSLPVIAFLYTLMTLDSAIRHWQGRGGAWKGRVYP